MSDHQSRDPPDRRLAEKLSELALRLKGVAVARRVWDDLLTDEERAKSGFEEFARKPVAEHWIRLRGVLRPRAVLELAHGIGFLTPQEFQRLLARIGEEGPPAGRTEARPMWDKELCELRLQGRVIKRVRGRKVAKNVCLVLDAFQEDNWPHHVLDPLPGGPNSTRVHKTVESLNRGLEAIRFRADGSGEGFTWERRPSR